MAYGGGQRRVQTHQTGPWLARGGQRTQFEGSDEQHNENWRTVVVEFPSMEQARTWYESREYTHAREIRQANSIGRLFIVEGYAA